MPAFRILFLTQCLLFATLIVGFSHGALVKNAKYKIQNLEDGLFLTVLKEGRLCKNLGPVTTLPATEVQSSTDQIWQASWLGSSQEDIRVRLGHAKFKNELSFADFPPYCYLQFQWLTFDEVKGTNDTYMIQKKDSKLCLVSHGLGQRATFVSCDSECKAQQWRLKSVG